MTDAPTRISPSSLKMYQGCARKYEIRHVLRVKEPTSVAGLTGTFVHKVLEYLFQLPANERTVTAAVSGLDAMAWADLVESDDWLSVLPTEAESAAIYRDGLALISATLGLENAQTVDVVATERRFEVDIEGVTLSGVIDRVDRLPDGTIAINDYKTGKVREPDFRQLLLYAEAWTRLMGEAPTRGRYIFARGGILDAEITEGGREAMVRDLLRTWGKITANLESGIWRPKPGPLCGWCPYVARCSEGATFVRRRYAKRRDVPAFALLRPGPAV